MYTSLPLGTSTELCMWIISITKKVKIFLSTFQMFSIQIINIQI